MECPLCRRHAATGRYAEVVCPADDGGITVFERSTPNSSSSLDGPRTI